MQTIQILKYEFELQSKILASIKFMNAFFFQLVEFRLKSNK